MESFATANWSTNPASRAKIWEQSLCQFWTGPVRAKVLVKITVMELKCRRLFGDGTRRCH
jgi:hypothetical protein